MAGNKKLRATTKATASKLKKAKSTPPARAVSARKLSNSLAPLDNRLVIETEGMAEKTAGGIFIPATVRENERPSRGRVLAKGPGRRDRKGRVRPLDVKIGDHILFSAYAAAKVEIDGREVLILREEDVLGIVT